MENKIKHQLNYHIVPFAYKSSYAAVQNIYKSKCDAKLWKAVDMGDENLLKHINDLISINKYCPSTIACRYILDQKGRVEIGLPNKKDTKLTLKTVNGIEYKIIIESIELVLFESQIGFVILNFKYPETSDGKEIDIDAIIELNYIIKHLYISKNILEYEIKKSRDEIESRQTRISEIISKITEELIIQTYFENYNDVRVHKTLLYNAVIFDKCFNEDQNINKQRISEYLFKMRRVFKESYKASESQLSIDNNSEILQLFDNSYWGMSLEAVASLCYCVEDETTNQFIDSNYIHRLENSYLFLYLIILHMRYSLLYFSILSSILPKSIKECIDLEKNLDTSNITISKLEEMISFFKLRCVFRDVSNVTHQKMLYDKMWTINNVGVLLEELDSEISALAVMASLRKNQEEKEEKASIDKKKKVQQKKEDRFKDLLVAITTAFTVLSAIANITKITESLKKIWYGGIFCAETAVLAIIIIIVVVFIKIYTRYIRGKKEEPKVVKRDSM